MAELLSDEYMQTDEYFQIKMEVFKIIRVHGRGRSPKKVMLKIKERLPNVPVEVIRRALSDLYTQ